MSGVFGIYSNKNKDVSRIIYYGLYALQHRGQDSAGIAINNNGYIDYHKDLGLAQEVFNNDELNRLRGNIGIGHIRQSKVEENTIANAEPLVVGYKKRCIGSSLRWCFNKF